jgi:hypothetical protein
MDPFALRMAKRAVNTTLDIQGFHNSLLAVYDQHWVGHAHAWAVSGVPGRGMTDLDGMKSGNQTSGVS